MIVDKTVLTKSGTEHRSLNWVLTHERYVKPGGTQYSIADDYYGFFPVDRPEYQIKDLSPYSNVGLDSLASYYNMAYFTDAYGIYQNEWYRGRDINERSAKVYGGLMRQDYVLMRMMYENRKLLLSEFNIIASPTPLSVRDRVQNLLNIDFSGWTGRYYHSLDTIENADIPRWMRRMHQRYYDRPFDYPDLPGIVLIHENDRNIVVLEMNEDYPEELEHEVPIIYTKPEFQRKYNLPDYIRYPFWFDITFAKDTNDIMATYTINTTKKGDSALAYHHIPSTFPAVIGDHKENLKYYFCGDFSDNPIPFGLSYFKGVEYIRKIFYNNRDLLDRKKFFWEYYQPLIKTILGNYYNGVMKDTTRFSEYRRLEIPDDYVPYYRKYNYRRPSLGNAVDNQYNPNTLYGRDSRESELFNEDSEYENEESSEGDKDNVIGNFLKNVGEVDEEDIEPDTEDSEKQEEKTEKSDASNESSDPEEQSPKPDSEKQETNPEDEQTTTPPAETVEETENEPEKEISEPVFLADSRYMVGVRKPLSSFMLMAKAEKTPAQIEEEPVKEETVNTVVEEAPIVPKEEPTIQIKESTTTSYKIVVASFDKREDAEAFIKNKGISAEIYYISSIGYNRVVVSDHAQLGAAQQSLTQSLQRFPKAWIAKF